MNDEFDPLETELAALTPRAASPGLAQRVAADLETDLRPRAGRLLGRLWLAATCAGAVAAGTAAAIWLWPRGMDDALTQPRYPAPNVSTAFDPSLPTVWSFRRGANESSAELDAMLDQHSAQAPPLRSEFVQTRGFGASETELHDLLGEL